VIPAFFALLLVVSDYFGVLSSSTPKTPRWPVLVWIGALVLTYAAQLGIIAYAAGHQVPLPGWRLAMPLAAIDDRNPVTLHGDLLTASMLALAALQSYALLAIYRLRSSRAVIVTGCALLVLLSLVSPALLSFDMYGYVHDALLGLAAYDPPAVPMPGAYHLFDLWFGGPNSTLYGPLWLVLVHVVTSFGTTLFGKLIAWRVFCALVYLGLLVGLRALRMPARIVNVAALNPGLMLQYVANGHNDLVAVTLLVFAAIFVRTRWPLAFGTIGVAGLLKIPYALLGLPILSVVRSLPLRIAASVVMLALVAAISWIGGGSAYLNALTGHVDAAPSDVVHRVAGAAALALIALAFFGGRRLRSGVWAMPMLGAHIFSWYCIWGFGYALARRRILGYLLVCFPFVAMMLESAIERVWVAFWVVPAVALLSLFAPERRFADRLAAAEAAAA
jgi:hypothetical protein